MHGVVFALIGAVLGAALPHAHVLGAIGGAVLGVLVARLGRLSERVAGLERRLDAMARTSGHPLDTVPTDNATLPGPRPTAPAPTPAPAPASVPASVPATPQPGAASGPRPAGPGLAPAPGPAQAPAPRQRPPVAAQGGSETPVDKALATLTAWFTTGNVPVKVGVVLSIFGVGFLVKEAFDRDWIVVPLELRLILVALLAFALLALGWRLRASHRTYAVSIQGGGIAMLYVTIYAAFALYSLLPAGLAFTMLVAITVAGGTLAVLQDAKSLAVLGILGGFVAPVLTSAGSTDHVQLFSYYLLLDIAIFAIAWFKAWRLLNLLGFFFTFGIGTLWGVRAYEPELLATTEPFLVLFVALYMLIPVLFAQRAAPEQRSAIDGTLVFGTPVVAFALQAQLLGHTANGLAASALALAAAYFALAAWLKGRHDDTLRVLAEAQFGLGAAFLALAVPLAFDARWTSATWALQGAAMLWLGVRQQRRLALAAGVALQGGAAVALLNAFSFAELNAPGSMAATSIGAVALAVAGGFSGWWLDRAHARRWSFAPLGSAAFLVWAAAWGMLAGVIEIGRHAPAGREFEVLMMFVAALACVAALFAPRIDWPRLATLGFLATAFIALAALVQPLAFDHPLAHWAWVAWPLLFGAHYLFLKGHEHRFESASSAAHVIAFWALVYLVAMETQWAVGRLLGGAWPGAAALAAAAVVVALMLSGTERVAWPFAARRETYRVWASGGALLALGMTTLLMNAVSSGDALPLPYLPLLNPLELASLLVAFVAVHGFNAAREYRPSLAARGAETMLAASVCGLFLVTMGVARAAHHWGGVPFDFDRLAASTLMQAALSIVWGTAALAGMLLGARFARRNVWVGGAALMAVVVVKLFVVELGNAGTVGRVVSFLGVGALLLVVGYFAPAPPRGKAAEASAP